MLYEERESEKQQLALNERFEEFERREHSEKGLQIINELNKRKEKESEGKRLLDQLTERIRQLIAEEKRGSAKTSNSNPRSMPSRRQDFRNNQAASSTSPI